MTVGRVAARMLIDGAWISERDDAEVIVNPATEEALGSFPHASRADLEAAVASAERGLRAWRATTPDERCQILMRAAALLRERVETIAPIVTLEQGKPLAEARSEIRVAAGFLDWDANEGKRVYGRTIPGRAGFDIATVREPVGVVAGFSPWNFPVVSAMRKLASPLSAGCAVILKAAEKTPASATALVECLVDAGLPKGVLNLVFGVPSDISDFLIRSPQVRMITLTGSVAVGKQLAALAGAHMKPALMELGGHAPAIVCDDVDPVTVGRLAAEAKFRNAGQICTSPSRFLVHDRIHDRFVESFVDTARSIRIGDGLADGTQMGPLVRADRRRAMERLVADSVARGATLRTGGNPHGNRGFFFEPTVLTDVPMDADIMNLEPFGPVAPVVRFTKLDEALDIANSLPFGLASYAFTNSAANAGQIAGRIEAGGLAINHFGGSLPETPFGGIKDSGYGREGGIEGVSSFLTTKIVSHSHGSV